jgi:aspartyl-tRNA(Asn)/glutamyl-tRNA(Gln) amidotransferase subunit B
MSEVSAYLNNAGKSFDACLLSPAQLAQLLLRIKDGTISGKIAKDVFRQMWAQASGEGIPWKNREGVDESLADRIIESQGLRQISDSSALEKLVQEVLTANPKSVEEFKAGKEKAFNALVGQVMKAARGKANPAQVNEILRKRLTE